MILESETFLHVADVPEYLKRMLGVRISVSSIHKKWMPSLGTGPKPAGRWGGKPIYHPADVLQWAKDQIREERA